MSASTVTLIDGTTVPADSEAWRHECEARHVAHLPGTENRHAYISYVQRRRSQAAADALRELATRIRAVEVLSLEADDAAA